MADATMGAAAGHITLPHPATATAFAAAKAPGGSAPTAPAIATTRNAGRETRVGSKRKSTSEVTEAEGGGRASKLRSGAGAAAGASGSGAVQQQIQQQQQQKQQQYVRVLEAHRLNEVPLLNCEKGKHYFREQALNPSKAGPSNRYNEYNDYDDYDDYEGYGSHTGYGGKSKKQRGGGSGGETAAAATGGGELMRRRLRRITEELATLATSLPVTWDSSILLAVDEERVDVLRALLLPAGDTPYAHGAFEFDILLPQDYPNSPPRVSGGVFLKVFMFVYCGSGAWAQS
jgi:baculoviral IAP repeat-containing protein 6